jgi:hypothetical protein
MNFTACAPIYNSIQSLEINIMGRFKGEMDNGSILSWRKSLSSLMGLCGKVIKEEFQLLALLN